MKDKSECCEIVIDILPWKGPRNFRFLEKHGWFDETSNTYVVVPTNLGFIEEGWTLEEAEAMYAAAKAKCVRNGYVHSFAPDCFGEGSYVYELIEP